MWYFKSVERQSKSMREKEKKQDRETFQKPHSVV